MQEPHLDAHIEIQEGEKVRIPEEYHKINDICAIIYDQLTEIYKDDLYKDLNLTTIELNEAKDLIKDLDEQGIHILDWLKENNRKDEIEQVLTKHLVTAVTSDFVNFVFESLCSAKRGHMTVAYSLARKPFNDLLVILEELLINRTDFIERFFHDGNPIKYDPSSKKLDKLSIIEQAVKKLEAGVYSPSFVHDLRYSKETGYGLSSLTNHALHIVTNDKRYKTPDQNLNFVFSVEEDFDRYFNHYYTVVPYLLCYTAAVVDEIIFDLLDNPELENLKRVKAVKRMIGIAICMDRVGKESENASNRIFDLLSEDVECEKCGHNNKIERADLELFLSADLLLCVKCFTDISKKVSGKLTE